MSESHNHEQQTPLEISIASTTSQTVWDLSMFLQRKADFVMEMETFLDTWKWQIQEGNIDKLADFKRDISIFITRVFRHKFTGKSSTFVLAFEQSNLSKYQAEGGENAEQEKKELMILLKEKNKLYGLVILRAMQLGILDGLLSPEEQHDIGCIISSNILYFFDEAFISWFASASDEKNKKLGIKRDTPQYGGIKDDSIVGYNSFSGIRVDESLLAAIGNSSIRAYLTAITKLIDNGVTDYSKWVGAELHESKIWKNNESRLGFFGPMEDYVHPGVLIEPEIAFLLKDPTNTIDNGDFSSLSSKHFDDTYRMDHITCTYAEPLLTGGDVSYSRFLGKAFPNNHSLAEKEGNNVIISRDSMGQTVENAKKPMKKLFPGESINFKVLLSELAKQATYHEFGHSLFVKVHPTSLLEEAKASLFYYLDVYDAREHYYPQDIVIVTLFSVMDSLRNIERMDKPEYLKYFILTEIVLAYLFESGLLEIGEDGLVIHPETDRFESFLTKTKDLLYKIRDLYALDEDTMRTWEDGFLGHIDAQAMPYIGYIKQKMSV